ncbi:uncharacterized protein CIMG_13201 [Coccidioides immitis RS]|uniref:Protein kinase domain-containing protein n=1 Tax=Coccidioides immitis (strain RS) TaxID=246410 RepID=J3K5I5_COCIM|nr:uncharacterized protein CIMG_13201 [Coccidioides immitis RS]EAS29696.3 hypothetical protein CIMG_13201 [Coccidioides immitis RS]
MEILQGIAYIHCKLQITHGSINCQNVFVSFTGCIKIGDIGGSMLSGSKDNPEIDTQSVGFVMREIMEPGHSYLNPKTFTLDKPEKWSLELLEFFEKTKNSTGTDLLNHVFLAYSPGPGCLSPPAVSAGCLSKREWKPFG